VDPEVPDRLICDAVRLRQILVNLVGNAIKFTDRGQVVIGVNAEPPAENKVALHFRVTDTGIGIPADKRVAIFAPFIQADGSTTRLYGGTGLGLAISSQLASLMGGKIWVESEGGRGSTFHFTVQVAISEIAPVTTDAFPLSLQGLRVLVVGDQANPGRLLEKMLTFWGLETTLADNGQAALACLVQSYDAGAPFSLVLIDVMMAEMDGITLARRLNADPQLEGKVLLMLTPADRLQCTDRLRSAGIAACLYKPIQKLELKAAILTALHPAPRIGDPVPPPSTRSLRILVAEDNPFNQRVAALMLAKMGHEATIAVNGREAVAALETQSFDVVLMDLQMPEMDGFQATAAIRTTEAASGCHIPIIALTAHAMKEDRDRCLQAGMNGYVSKPIRQDQLRREIEQVMGATAQLDGEPVRLNGHIDLSTVGNDSGSLPCIL
jgi:two-component system, sensor histidine kinase and response regulator